MRFFVSLKNKILILSIFIFCFLLAGIPFFTFKSAYAEPDYTPLITVESKTVHRGQTFEIAVNISGNQGLTALYLSLEYDSSVMQLTGFNRGNALNGLTLTTDNTAGETGYAGVPFNLSWADETPDNSNGTIITLVFQSFSENVVLGDYPVNLTYDPENTRSDYNVPIGVDIINGTVTLIEGAYKVYYRDYDGTVLYEKDYNEGTPSYVGNLPSRAEDAEYSYEFVGWKGVVSDNPSVIIFEADYKKTAQVYSIFYYVDGYNGEPDGIIDETDYFTSYELAFGSEITPPLPDEKLYYKFVGWYKNENYTESFIYGTMPSHNVRLYGYYKFDVRDKEIPEITLTTVDYGDDYATVSVSMIKNTGFNAVSLTLDYDLSALTLTGFDRGDAFSSLRFSHTNIEKIAEEGFKFYFSSDTENNYETGVFLILNFAVKNSAEKGTYDVTFTYDKTDATYYVGNGDTKYTMLKIVDAEVPIGKINHWTDTVGNKKEIEIDIVSKDDKPINVKMYVEMITDAVDIEEDKTVSAVGERFNLSSAYTIKLLQNGVEIAPNTTLTVKIKLNAKEQKSNNLKFFYLHDDGTMEEHDFTRDGEYLVFETDHLSEWLIFSDYNNVAGFASYALLIILPILLAIATMGFALIVIGKNRKKETD